jgi:hypothetical protein
MTLRLPRKLNELAEGGAWIVAKAQAAAKVSEVGGSGRRGRTGQTTGHGLWLKPSTGQKAADVRSRGVMPDFCSQPALRYIHRQAGEADIYFVANPQDERVQAQAIFRVSGK